MIVALLALPALMRFVTSLHPAGFDELMPKTLATATVDRLLHHAHVCQTSGDSVRLTRALAGKGVTRLN
jgi:DNA replication protein DnaC